MHASVQEIIRAGEGMTMPATPAELHTMRIRCGLQPADLAYMLGHKAGFIADMENHRSHVIRQDAAALVAGFDEAAEREASNYQATSPLVMFWDDEDFEMMMGSQGCVRLRRLLHNEAQRRRHYAGVWNEEAAPLTWFDRRTWRGGDLAAWAADHISKLKRRPAA